MARNLDAKCRQCRREGEKLFLKGEKCFTDKCAIERRAYAPGQHGQKSGMRLSDYGKRNLALDYTFQRIWDGRAFTPDAFMPLYGPGAVLTESEIQDVIAFLQTGK